MKRSRDVRPSARKDPSGALAKAIRPQTESSSTRGAAIEPGKKPEKDRGDEEKRPGTEEQEVKSSFPTSEGASVGLPAEEAMEATWDVTASDLSGWWWWGVEEDVLLGWFPFADEHFVCSESIGGGGFLCAEEEGLDHDIWQLQHIHDIPSTAK